MGLVAISVSDTVRILGVNVTVLGLLMSKTLKLAASSDSSAAHDDTVFVLGELSDLVTLDVLATSSVVVVMRIVLVALDSSAMVLIGAPVAVSVVVSVVRDPRVDTLGIRLAVVEVGALLVLSVEGNRWSLSELLTLGVILDDLPVLLD